MSQTGAPQKQNSSNKTPTLLPKRARGMLRAADARAPPADAAHGVHVRFTDMVSSMRPVCPCEWMDAEDPLFILYTSGSTGRPKGQSSFFARACRVASRRGGGGMRAVRARVTRVASRRVPPLRPWSSRREYYNPVHLFSLAQKNRYCYIPQQRIGIHTTYPHLAIFFRKYI